MTLFPQVAAVFAGSFDVFIPADIDVDSLKWRVFKKVDQGVFFRFNIGSVADVYLWIWFYRRIFVHDCSQAFQGISRDSSTFSFQPPLELGGVEVGGVEAFRWDGFEPFSVWIFL